MAQISVVQFASELGLPPALLLEQLQAAGVKREEVFPLTKEKAEMALAKVAELKPSISVWWGAGAQPPQLLSTGELALSSAWSGRMLAATAEGAPVGFTYKDGIAWANWWVIPKGSPNVDTAHELINYALAAENLRQDRHPGIRYRHDTCIRFDRGKGVVGGKDLIVRQRIEQGGLADIRQPDDSNREAHLVIPKLFEARARRQGCVGVVDRASLHVTGFAIGRHSG